LNGQNSFGRDLIELGVFRTAGKPVSTYEVQVYPQKLPLNPGQFFHFFLPHDF
jgi:hypothetical protein